MADIPINILAKEKNLLQVMPLGDEMPYDFKKPHRHEYFEFFIFTKNGGTHYIDFEAYPIAENSVHIIFPGQVHLLKREGAKGWIIVCLKEFMSSLGHVFYSQLFQNNYTAPCIPFSNQAFSEVLRLTALLQMELNEQKILMPELTKSYTSAFLSYCIREFDSLPSVVANHSHPLHELNVYRSFLLLLEQHVLDKQNVAFYAAQMAMTAKKLNHCIKKATGKNCIDLIQERTLTEAKRLLLYTDDSSKEIAYKLNFKDNSYFTRFFTRLEGKTPGGFRVYWEEKYHS